jgi:hypothetical protein
VSKTSPREISPGSGSLKPEFKKSPIGLRTKRQDSQVPKVAKGSQQLCGEIGLNPPVGYQGSRWSQKKVEGRYESPPAGGYQKVQSGWWSCPVVIFQ